MDQPVNPFRKRPNGQDDNTLPTVDLVGDVTLPPRAPNGATPHPLQQAPQAWTPVAPPTNPLPKGPKSKVLALVLLVFLGIFGAHNFYLKHYKVAVFQLLCGLFLFHSEVAGVLDTVRVIFVLWLVANFLNILRAAGRYSENF
ncbi:hypothetical protein GCM10009621_04110 [Corynebacterium felinum]|uniref:TM2 domain-containing protein n=2 Tax=Corynebacterium felinum TaxID=131318 RepID=A0ABU2B5M8_9CORY|nr:TM2 domain-containing protein [Corynebacterium felinum]MDR7353926.1 hypothetical protein [Corynebacterium felinum]